jgi:hypothetical protein
MDKFAVIEHITSQDRDLAIIISRAASPPETTFVSKAAHPFQAGFIVYPAGSVIARHEHLPVERRLSGTSEVLVVRKGCCDVSIYDCDRRFVTRRRLETGDIIVLLAGGHSFDIVEDCILFEIKQGPYMGPDEKVRY